MLVLHSIQLPLPIVFGKMVPGCSVHGTASCTFRAPTKSLGGVDNVLDPCGTAYKHCECQMLVVLSPKVKIGLVVLSPVRPKAAGQH